MSRSQHDYYLYTPKSTQNGRIYLLVILSDCQGSEAMAKLKTAFSKFAETQKVAILIPSNNGSENLLETVQKAKSKATVDIFTERFLLYGFGEKTAFVNRFTFQHASKLLAVSMGAMRNITQLTNELTGNMAKYFELSHLNNIQVHLFLTKKPNSDNSNKELDILEQALNNRGVVTRKSVVPANPGEEEKVWLPVMNFFADTLKILRRQ